MRAYKFRECCNHTRRKGKNMAACGRQRFLSILSRYRKVGIERTVRSKQLGCAIAWRLFDIKGREQTVDEAVGALKGQLTILEIKFRYQGVRIDGNGILVRRSDLIEKSLVLLEHL